MFRPLGLYPVVMLLLSGVLPTSLKNSNQPAETMLVRSPMYHCQLYIVWPHGVPKLSRWAYGK